jgi:hypothetical protein
MMSTPVVTIPGIQFDFGGGQCYVVPPLSLGALEQLESRLGALQLGSMDRASVATVVDATHAALRRNYPALTREEVAELVDLSNMADVIGCVMDVAGMRRKELQSQQPGKAVPEWVPVQQDPPTNLTPRP